MSLNLSELKYEVVDPALRAIGLNSPAALNLVTGTALVESGCVHLKQVGTGPALGLWQIEPATDRDVWSNFLAFRDDLAGRVRALMYGGAMPLQLVCNMAYGAAMCRLIYRRSPMLLPAEHDAGGMAAMWKAAYNTRKGAGEINAARVNQFAQAIAA